MFLSKYFLIQRQYIYTLAERGQSKLKFYYRNLIFLIQTKVLLSKFKIKM